MILGFGCVAQKESLKVIIKQETGLQCARIEESDMCHLQLYHHMRGWQVQGLQQDLLTISG